MSGTARTILLATGEQDKLLTFPAQFTYFKKSYLTYPQFNMNWVIQSAFSVNNAKEYPSGGTVNTRIDLNGDIMNDIVLRFKLNISEDWLSPNFVRETVLGIIDNIQFKYSDKILSEFDSDYLVSYFELNLEKQRQYYLQEMMSYDYNSKSPYIGKNSSQPDVVYIYLPLPLWFCRQDNDNIALHDGFPLWALYDPNINLTIKTKDFKANSNRIVYDIETCILYGYLAPEEKEKIKNLSLEYKIQQSERITIEPITKINQTYTLIPSYFVYNYIWVIKKISQPNNYFYEDDLIEATILFNGKETITANNNYYKNITRFKNYYGNPSLILDSSNSLNPIYTTTFNMEPLNNTNVSGYVTPSKFNQVNLQIKTRTTEDRMIHIYQEKYNIIRIKNGYLEIVFK